MKQGSGTSSAVTAADERSPMLHTPLGELAPTVAALVRVSPLFGQRLLLAPPAAFHAYVIHMHALPQDWRNDPAATARHMLETSPRTLLGNVMPDAPPTLWRALRRLEQTAIADVYYRCLATLLQTRLAHVVLAAQRLDRDRISMLLEMLDLDPLVVAAHRSLNGDYNQAYDLNACLGLLRSQGVLESDERAARVLRKVSPTGLWDFVRRRLDNASAPPLPVTLSPPLRALTTVRELVETGRRFGNCLGKEPQHMLDLVSGRRRFVILDGEPPLVAEIEIFDSGLFAVLHTEAPHRAPVPWQSEVAIIRALCAFRSILITHSTRS
jgi:hypothetical protein